MTERVVITGLGPISPLGLGKEAFFQNLNRMAPCIEPIPQSFLSFHKFGSRHRVPLPRFNPEEYGIPGYYLKAMQAEDKMAVLGAKLALADAGYVATAGSRVLEAGGLPGDTAVILGTGFSGLGAAFNSFLAHIGMPDFQGESTQGRKNRFQRMIIPRMMPNSISAWVSIFFKLQGPNHTMNASCASGTYAVGEAFRAIREGRARLALCGGVENLHDDYGAIMRGFDLLGVLTKSPDGLPGSFSKNRNGFLFSEGAACLLVLEEREHAIRRKADIYAEIMDYQANSDAYNIVQIEPSGERAGQVLEKLRGERHIDYLNAHGTGTIPNDKVEQEAIQRVFGDIASQPVINSTKNLLGHTLGASGAFEAAVTAYAVKTDMLHGMYCPEPLEGLNIITEPKKHRVQSAISVSYGFGGHNGGLLFEKADE